MKENVYQKSVATDFAKVAEPQIHQSSYIHPKASVIGAVFIGADVMVSPCASIRGDEGQSIYIGARTNVQDCCVVHGLETEINGKIIPENLISVAAKHYSVYIAEDVSLAHQSQVHGPAYVGTETFVGMQALVFKAIVGKGCVIEPGAKIVGVEIADGRCVPMGAIINKQKDADKLPKAEDSVFAQTNKAVVHVNVQLAAGYLDQN